MSSPPVRLHGTWGHRGPDVVHKQGRRVSVQEARIYLYVYLFLPIYSRHIPGTGVLIAVPSHLHSLQPMLRMEEADHSCQSCCEEGRQEVFINIFLLRWRHDLGYSALSRLEESSIWNVSLQSLSTCSLYYSKHVEEIPGAFLYICQYSVDQSERYLDCLHCVSTWTNVSSQNRMERGAVPRQKELSPNLNMLKL